MEATLWKGLLDVYQQRLRAHPISCDWQGGIPPRTWEGWAFLAQDYAALVVPLDNPVFRVRQAVKIALQADAANLSGIGPVDWTAVEDQICNLMIGAIPANQIPATQIEVPVAPRDEIPVIIMQERQKRGKRNDLRYLVALPGQSDGDGEWYSRRELITDFPENWETMLERWRDFLFQKHQERVQKESNGQQAVEVVHLDHRLPTAAAGGGGDGGGNAGNDTNTDTDTDTNRKNMQKNKTSPGDDEHVGRTDKEVIDPGDDGSGAAASNQGEATAGGQHDHQASAILGGGGGGGGGGNGNIPEQAMHHPVDDGEAALLDHADSAGAGRRGNNLAAMAPAPAAAAAADAFRPPPLPAPHVEGTSTTAYQQRVLLPPLRATSRPLSAPDGVTVLALAGQARRQHPRDGGVHHDFAAELRPMPATNGTLVDPQWQFLPAAMPRQADTAAAPASISRHQPEALPLQQSPQPQEEHHRHALTNNHTHDQQPQKKRVKRDLYSIMQSMSKGRPASPLHSPAAAAAAVAAPPLRSAASPQQQQLAPTSQRTSPRVSRIWQACGALTQQQRTPQALVGSKLSPSMTQQRTTTMSTDMSVATGVHPLVASNIAYARQHGYAMALPSIATNGAAARDVREPAPNAEGGSAAAHVDESNEDAAAADVAPKKISAASKRRQRRAAPSRQQPQKTKTAAAVTVAVVHHVADNTKNPDKIRGGDDAKKKRASPPPAQPKKAKGRALAPEGGDALREANPKPHAGAADPDTGTNGDTVRVEGAEKTHKMEAEDAPAGTPTRRPRRVASASKAAAAGNTKQAEGEKGRRQQALRASLPAVIPDTESEREGTGQDGSASRGSIEDVLDSYLSTDKWSDARITGAKEVDGGISVWIEWADGFSAIVPSVQLRRNDRVHCMVSLIQFYESKTKKRKRKS